MNAFLSQVDHLVYAAPDLPRAIDIMEALLGVRATTGGSHPQWGTANALLSLGDSVYLEIIGPDPEQADFKGERVFGIDQLAEPKLVTWSARSADFEALSLLDLGDGQNVGPSFPASRAQPDGTHRGRAQWPADYCHSPVVAAAATQPGGRSSPPMVLSLQDGRTRCFTGLAMPLPVARPQLWG